MRTLISFELRKILGNRAGMVACILALALVAGMALLNLGTAATQDYRTGAYVDGFAAQQAFKEWRDSHAGTLDDKRVGQDVADYLWAQEQMEANDDVRGMTATEVIEAYGEDFYHRVFNVAVDGYYERLYNTLNASVPMAQSLESGAAARLELDLDEDYGAQFSYSQAEEDYWRDKAANVEWPLEFGSAIAWENTLDFLTFLGLVIVAACIALSGVFAGEYQARTAAVVLPTRRGKHALPAAKCIAAFAFSTVYWLIAVAILAGINAGICGTDGWSLPLQATDFANPYPLTMGGAVAALCALGYVMMLGMVALTLLLSAKLRSTMPVAVIPMAVALLGLFGLFVKPLAKLAALTPMSALDWSVSRLVSYAAGPLVLDLPMLAGVIYAMLLVVLLPLAARAFKRHQVA